MEEDNKIKEYLTKAVINELNNIRDFAQKMSQLNKDDISFFTYDKIIKDRLKELKGGLKWKKKQ